MANTELERWYVVRNEAWDVRYYLELFEQFLKSQPQDPFFKLSFYAVQEHLIHGIDRAVQLCRHVSIVIEIGQKAEEKLRELNELHAKGDTVNRDDLKFPDAGIKVMRDKKLSHPAASIKELLGKPTYEVTVKLTTIQETVQALCDFCKAVEFHNAASWDESSHYDGLGDAAKALENNIFHLKLSSDYRILERDVGIKGICRVRMDYEKRRIVVAED